MTRLLVLAVGVVLATAVAPGAAHAVCTGGSVGGFTQYLGGQIPDVVLRAGVASSLNITPYYVAFSSTGGHCGIFARSTVPGTTVQDTYGCTGTSCIVHPAGEYAAVGSAYPVAFTTVAPNQSAGVNNDIPLAFNGSAPAGTQGFLELAYAANDVGDLSNAFVFARVPIYVEPASPASGWFRATSSASTVSGSRLVLNHPYLNGKPGARVFVSHVQNPTGASVGTAWNHPLAVEYDTQRARWTVKNVDGARMATGLAFNVRVDPTAKQVCVPPPTTGNEFVTFLAVDDYGANSNIYATLVVTPVSGPAHPVAVKYAAPSWGIVYADGAVLPGGACFNVKVIAFSQYIDDPAQGDLSGKSNTIVDNGVGQDQGPNGATHTVAGVRVLPFNWASGNLALPMIHTSNLTPMGWTPPASPDTRNTSAWITPACTTTTCTFPSRRWAFRHADGTPVPGLGRFNVWAEYQPRFPPN
jgi:hypothetical protein